MEEPWLGKSPTSVRHSCALRVLLRERMGAYRRGSVSSRPPSCPHTVDIEYTVQAHGVRYENCGTTVLTHLHHMRALHGCRLQYANFSYLKSGLLNVSLRPSVHRRPTHRIVAPDFVFQCFPSVSESTWCVELDLFSGHVLYRGPRMPWLPELALGPHLYLVLIVISPACAERGIQAEQWSCLSERTSLPFCP